MCATALLSIPLNKRPYFDIIDKTFTWYTIYFVYSTANILNATRSQRMQRVIHTCISDLLLLAESCLAIELASNFLKIRLMMYFWTTVVMATLLLHAIYVIHFCRANGGEC